MLIINIIGLLISGVIIAWWFITFEPSTDGKIGSQSYYFTPLMVYIFGFFTIMVWEIYKSIN